MNRPRILVTNDDGIDSVGLHVLARRLTVLGDVTVVAPDQEFSGAGAAIGALHVIQPEVHTATVAGIDRAWAVSGPPALCVMFVRLGAFGPLPDLIVSGINPGANVGRSVYHSGTVGATLTGRNGMIPGIAVSQSVADFGIEGQGYDEMLAGQHWESAAELVAVSAAQAVLADPPPDYRRAQRQRAEPARSRRSEGLAVDRGRRRRPPRSIVESRSSSPSSDTRAATGSSSRGATNSELRGDHRHRRRSWRGGRLAHLAERASRPSSIDTPAVDTAINRLLGHDLAGSRTSA